MIKEINRGEGLTQLIEWPEEMEVKRIHIQKRHKVEESPLDDVLFILGIILFTVMLCFGVVILQTSEIAYVLILVAMLMCLMTVAYRSGTKRGR